MVNKVARYKRVLIVLCFLLCLFLIYCFINSRKETYNSEPANTAESTDKFTPGVYTSVVPVNERAFNLEIIVDENHINSICITNLDDSISTMYPLIAPALEHLAEQLYSDVPFESIVFSEDSKYTQTVLLKSIQNAVSKAETQSNLDD